MKILLDENLSVRLLSRLTDHFPGSAHVAQLGLRGASDARVWQAAQDGAFVLVSKDDDFRSLALVRGAPPKVVILRIGNASTDEIAVRLLDARLQIEAFGVDAAASVLII